MNNFNIFKVKLSGKNLIEASAGTGKTYSIALLFLRLILKGHDIKKILVVTFTIAATGELKYRIRAFLKEAFNALHTGISKNSDIKNIIGECSEAKVILMKRLGKALYEFDEGQIFTIHGFCQKVIYEYAFECSNSFDGRLIGEEKNIIKKAVYDFWRTHFYNAPGDFLEYAINEKNISPSYFIKIIGNNYNKPGLTIEPLPALTLFGPEDNDKISGYDNDILILKHRLFSFVRKKIKTLKEEENIISYDDLLLILYYALKRKDGEILKKAVRERYRAVFIDEFQDTDPVQYEIFKELFHTSQNTIFYIGDPKQAIYSFRNADIFTYLKGTDIKNIPSLNKFTMNSNYRSAPSLIEAVSKIFNARKSPFFYDEIKFPAVKPGINKNIILTEKGEAGPSLNIWYLRADKFDKKYITGRGRYKFTLLSKTSATDFIVKGTCQEIARLMDEKENIKVGDTFISPSHIAVLTRSNREARIMKSALEEYKIPSIIHNTDSVFSTPEARDFATLIRAVAYYNETGFIKAALLTDIFGYTISFMDNLTRDEKEWEKWIDLFRSYYTLWNDRGFLSAFTRIVKDNNIKKRLLSFPSGKRKFTNFLHTGELVHKEEEAKKLNMAGILKYIEENLHEENAGNEDYELRIESDENAVKILTVHKSKGLEFPIVFCPFLWHSSSSYKKGEPIFYHDKNKNSILNIAGDKEAIEQSQQENFAESLRIMYVALTRARYRCYIFWGRINGSGTSAPAYIFHNCRDDKNFKKLDDRAMYEELTALHDNKTIAVSEIPDLKEISYKGAGPDNEDLKHAKEFNGKIDRNRHIISFTSLTLPAKQKHWGDEPDRDFYKEDPVAEITEEKPEGIFAFPCGKRAGNIFHGIFEEIDFQGSNLEEIVTEKLSACNLNDSWHDTVRDMIKKVITCRLNDGKKEFSLKEVPPETQVREMEFYFPLSPINSFELRNILGNHINCSDFRNISGHVHGYIDLVFKYKSSYYIVDWKSGYLGPSDEYYSQDRLENIIKEHNYKLQYMLYTVALNQYLSAVDKNYSYDKNFGGVFYIFLRGISRGKNNGIWFDRPHKNQIDRLTAYMVEKTNV